MQICVCGWYYFPELMPILKQVDNVFIVANRYDECLEDFDYHVRENFGVEYGAYDWFIKNKWDEKSSVLFMHDDVELLPFMKNYEIVAPERVFEALAKIEDDIAYVFRDKTDERINYGVHGRGIIMSARFIRFLLDNHDGIWWDRNNNGHIIGPTPEHCLHFNEADYRLRAIWRDLQEYGSDMMLGRPVYAPSFKAAYRGKKDWRGEVAHGKVGQKR